MSAWREGKLALLAVAAIFLVATYAQPKMNLERTTFRYVFVFDISQSMNVMDVTGFENAISRLDFAKQRAIDALSSLPCDSEIGLALFTGHRAYLLITPIETCANYRELSTMIENVSWRMTWKPRSEIAKGLAKSIKLLDGFDAPTRLVFFTDGHEAPPINPDIPPRFPETENDIKGMIVGVGGNTLVPIPKFDKFGELQGVWSVDEVQHIDAFTLSSHAREGTASTVVGTEHLSSLRETYLKELATTTGLDYVRVDGESDFNAAVTSRMLGLPQTSASDIRWLLGLVALLALIGSCLLPSRTT